MSHWEKTRAAWLQKPSSLHSTSFVKSRPSPLPIQAQLDSMLQTVSPVVPVPNNDDWKVTCQSLLYDTDDEKCSLDEKRYRRTLVAFYDRALDEENRPVRLPLKHVIQWVWHYWRRDETIRDLQPK